MQREAWRHQGYRSLAGWFCILALCSNVQAQGEPPRPRRAGGPPGGAGVPAAVKAPQPLAQNAKITLDGSGLSVDVQEQDLPSIVERIAALGQVQILHLEGLPNRRVSIRFTALPLVDGLKRLFRVADVPGYTLVTAPQGHGARLQRIIFLAEEGGTTNLNARGIQRPQAVAAVPPPRAVPPAPGTGPPAGTVAPPPPAPQTPQPEESKAPEGGGAASVFDDIKSNAAARRLLSQMMHPNEQVRERAFEGLVRLFREDEKQRALMEFLEPLMEDLTSEDKGTQDEAREEIRKLLSR